MSFYQYFKNIFRGFHSAIIAIIFLFALTACGYKTPPVYVPPEDKNITEVIKDSNSSCESGVKK